MNGDRNKTSKADNAVPAVSAIVLNYNGYNDTVKCIHSLQNATYPNLKILIVDNNSPDGSGDRLEATFPNISILQLSENTGYAAGNNAGIRFAVKSGAKYVLVINNDVVVNPAFLEPMVQVAENHSDVGVVTCKVYYQHPQEEIFSAVGKMNWWLCSGVNKGSHIRFLQKTEEQCDADFACGVLLLLRKEMLESLGLFDEKYFMYFEDVEYSRRILQKYKITYTPLGIAYHKSGGGKGWRSYSELYLYYHTRNRFWMFEKYPMWYRTYVAAFSLANVIGKTIMILGNIMHDRNKMQKQLQALWTGIKDGMWIHTEDRIPFL